MGIRKLAEVQADGPSLIIWEGNKGCRVVYQTETQAEAVALNLTERLNRFHIAKEANIGAEDDLMVTVYVYGDYMSEYQMIRRFISVVKSAGFEVQTGLERSQLETW